jgi:hypothetical protein
VREPGGFFIGAQILDGSCCDACICHVSRNLESLVRRRLLGG